MTDHRSTPRYALITPARNEARYIRLTLDSMAAQTHPPVRWVIVSDGSTDGTDDIVRGYCARLPWLRLVRLPEQRDRSFAAKVSGASPPSALSRPVVMCRRCSMVIAARGSLPTCHAAMSPSLFFGG